MPYIAPHLRQEVRDRYASDHTVDDPAAAAFLISDVIECSLPSNARYADRATAIGILFTCLHEAERQLLDNYEDGKRHQHGAVYGRHDV